MFGGQINSFSFLPASFTRRPNVWQRICPVPTTPLMHSSHSAYAPVPVVSSPGLTSPFPGVGRRPFLQQNPSYASSSGSNNGGSVNGGSVPPQRRFIPASRAPMRPQSTQSSISEKVRICSASLIIAVTALTYRPVPSGSRPRIVGISHNARRTGRCTT